MLRSRYYESGALRIVVAVVTIAAIAKLMRASREELGLRCKIDIDWERMIFWGLLCTLGVGVLFFAVASTALKYESPVVHSMLPRPTARLAFDSVLSAPLVEEPLYRVALCPTAARMFGKRWGIVASGVAFGALHFWYGNASFTNIAAGFVLGWLFYESRSVLLPGLVHGVGNGILFLLIAAARAHYGVSL